jgi:hypothetical protein
MGRLTAQKAWQSCTGNDSLSMTSRVRCGETPRPGTKQFARLEKAADKARKSLVADSSPSSLHAFALLELRWRDVAPAGLDRAIELLERARRRNPTARHFSTILQ